MLPRDHRRRRRFISRTSYSFLLSEIGLFLVCAYLFIGTIKDEKGVSTRLPSYTYEGIDTLRVPASLCLTVHIASSEWVQIEEKSFPISEARKQILKAFNIEGDRRLRAAILTYSPTIRYSVYLEVHDAIKAGISQMRNEVSLLVAYEPYSYDLSYASRKKIRQQLDFTYAEQEYYRMPDDTESDTTKPLIYYLPY